MINVSLNEVEMARVSTFVSKIAQKQARAGSRDHLNRDTGAHRVNQNIVGKVGELAATKVVGGDVDFTVWVAGSRGQHFDADVISTGARRKNKLFSETTVHVKTTHAKHVNDASRASWTIDRNDPLVDGGDGCDVIVLMFADETGKAAALGWVSAADVADLWKDCVDLRHKVAIYYSDIKSLITKF